VRTAAFTVPLKKPPGRLDERGLKKVFWRCRKLGSSFVLGLSVMQTKEFPMSLSVTTTYALLLLPIWLALWIGVASKRSELRASIGDAGDAQLLQKIRRHGNFIEFVPIVLVLMVLAELQGAGALWLHIAGALLVIGRIAHPFGLKIDNAAHPLRYVGNSTNLLAAAVLAVTLIRIKLGF
jgi:uncharacterized protein